MTQTYTIAYHGASVPQDYQTSNVEPGDFLNFLLILSIFFGIVGTAMHVTNRQK